MISIFPFLRNPKPLIQPVIDLADPLYRLSRGTLTQTQALRLSHQWAQLATRIALAAALCFGMRKLKQWAGIRAKNWFARQCQSSSTPGLLLVFLNFLQGKLTGALPDQHSRQINQIFNLYIKSGVACGIFVRAFTPFVARLLASRMEYRTTLLAFHFHYICDAIDLFRSIKKVQQLGSIFNALMNLKYAYSFMLALQQLENSRLILARLHLLSSDEMQQIDPQVIEGLAVNHILTHMRIPQEDLALPVGRSSSENPGSSFNETV